MSGRNKPYIVAAGLRGPEHHLGEPLDARSDLFSVGAVLYEALSGDGTLLKRAFAEICENIRDFTVAEIVVDE